jgi:hypothetical protein
MTKFESEKIINTQVKLITESEQFKKWFESVKPKKDGYVVFNNSFLFRENEKRKKGLWYLGLSLKLSDGGLKLDNVLLLSGMSLNSDYQYFQEGSPRVKEVLELSNEATRFINEFGRVGFVLIGEITDDAIITQEIHSSGYEKLVLSPKQKDILSIQGNDVVIRELLDDDALWHELQNQHQITNKTTDELPDELGAPLAKALNGLREEAFVRLKIPDSASKIGRTMLDDIISAFDYAVTEYKKSLDICSGDYRRNPEQFTNILRIAYNFSSDALDFLKVIVHMSDLKPIVLFTTANSQFVLSNVFRDLPWPRSEQKGSLTLYDTTVKGARNYAFHRLFPFSKAIEVDVDGLSFKATKLRLFPEYGSKSKKKTNVDFEDRDLIELLTQFSRTVEHTVTPVFWQKNLAVMESTVALLKQFKIALLSILSDQKGIKS